jgi:hypothetical protein
VLVTPVARICDSIVPALRKVRQMKSTDPLRNVNANSLLELVLATGGNWLPPDDAGAFCTRVWARLLGNRDERTIQRWVKELAIPVSVAGDQQLIEARDMRRFLHRLREADKKG